MAVHTRLRPSSAYRWMVCAGAPRLEATIPEGSSSYAIEGTAAHGLAEMCLREGRHPAGWIGTFIAVEDSENAIEVTQEMADAVDVFVQYVRSCAEARDARLEVETRVDLDALNPPEPMGGTVDAMIWQPHVRTLIIADYKHGQGVVVEAEGNPQLGIYALGAVLYLGVRPDRIIMTIVQPRAEHPEGPIRMAEWSWKDLLAFRQEVMVAAYAAHETDAPVGPVGDHCQFCRAKAICPAQRSNALVVAQQEFDSDLPVAGIPEPQALTMDQLTEVLDKAPYVEDWIKAVREYARTELEQGREVPGYKLVAKRATRYWVDEAEAEGYLRRAGKLKVGQIAPRKLISPAQAEKLVKLPEHLVQSRSSGYNLAPESNPKPAITPGIDAADEFDVP